MYALAPGQTPVQRNRVLFARAAIAAMIAALGGCASNPNNTSAQYSASNVRVAQAATDVEADGLPAQIPPARRARQTPDDPAEPFSSNYGGVNPSASAAPLTEPQVPKNAPKRNIPDDLPAAFRQKLVTALAEDE